jgi:predicted NBD/HSP70 family sugar kinase
MGGFGHMCIEPNGELCSCGRKGCWETLASESATIARYHRLMSNKNGSITTSITDIIALANRGDEKAIAALTATAEYLGEGIASLAHGLSPESIVIGGEIMAAKDIVIEAIIVRAKELSFSRAFETTRILSGDLGDNAAAVGAALLANRL